MKLLKFYSFKLDLKNEDDVFKYFLDTLKPSNTLWSYFVDWKKVFRRVDAVRDDLAQFNSLIGDTNFDESFRKLIKHNPILVRVLPLFLAAGTGNGKQNRFDILVDFSSSVLVHKNFDFNKENIGDADIDLYLEFIRETGLRDLLVSKKIINIVDYMIGVEAGLDSNGRKNRSGHAMEAIVNRFIQDFCKKHSLEYLKEANAQKIFNEWGITVPVDKSSRRYDFVIKKGTKLYIFETNFYGGGGSKLSSISNAYQHLFSVIDNKYTFVWITDGLGWKKTHRPLRETFDHTDFVLNLSMIEAGIFEDIIV